MARPRKVRLEGASYAALQQGSEAERAPGLRAIVEDFKERFPEDWEAIRLCPTWHGFEIMAERLANG